MKQLLTGAIISLSSLITYAQNGGNLTGNVESTFQYLNSDTLIGADQPASKGLLNSYMNVFYTNGNFKAGVRLESYLPRIQGYPDRFDGTGLGMRYVGYSNDMIDVTLGNFYEQFGNGMSFRSYEERALGYDNNMDGMRLIFRPYKGITLKGVYGKQRLSFNEGKVITGQGLVRGLDADIRISTLWSKLEEKGIDLTVGASLVSKYQKDDNPELIMPENVASYGGRLHVGYKGFRFEGEYIYKDNDPSEDNAYSYNRGHAAFLNFGYSRKGFGINFSAKSVDNMSFRSDRTKGVQDLFINYLPSLNKTHTYNLVASLYPYATQPNGEVAYQGTVVYTVKKGSALGGKYGLPIELNYSTTYGPVKHTSGFSPQDSTGVSYEGRLYDKSGLEYWHDFNVMITKKFSSKYALLLSYYNISLNNDISKISDDAKGIINSNIFIAEFNYKHNRNHSFRVEAQGLWTEKDKGNWATLVLEYNLFSKFTVAVMDQYNYGNNNPDLRVHYLIGSFVYTQNASRFMVNYGRQREGMFCVGGVCRYVPASNGLTLTFTHSF